MPVKVLPSTEAFNRFGELVSARGFHAVTVAEFRRELAGVKLIPPEGRRKREGRTLAYRYGANGMVVWVWTTYMPDLERAAENAAGWVLIVQNKSIYQSSHPVPRTKNFLHTLLWLAVIAKWRVDHRPACPICGSLMGVGFGTELKSRYWRCRNRQIHAGMVSLDWKYDLPEAALEFERKLDDAREKRFAAERAAGKEPGRALKRRKRWIREPPP